VEALASFYVLEGSVLGGAVLKRLISTQCPGVPEAAFSFFAGYGEENGAMWRTFLARLNAAMDTGDHKEKAVAAANACFAGLEAWIRTCYKDPA
jgi:heme oxygenase